MRSNQQRFLWFGVSILGVLTSPALFGQASRSPEATIPVPSDWSHRSVIFSRPATTEQAKRVEQDPRYWQQRYRRELPVMVPAAQSRDALASELRSDAKVPRRRRNQELNRAWQESMGTGASVGAGNFPAKFSFLGTTANCGTATQPDFVVYSTGLEGSTTQASVVAYDNLYAGCIGTVPSVYWAYNTGGKILTSPAFSRDGTQVAFVETEGGFGLLVLLKWSPSPTDTIGTPETLTPVLAAAYPSCSAPCMTEILLSDSELVQTDDTTSSIFVDYSGDTGWVGGASGWLHKITPLFKGVPAEEHDLFFPVQVNPTNPTALSSPVHDYATGNVFVGDFGGYLYWVDSTTAAVTQSGQLDHGTGIVEGPIVDSTSGLVYVFSSSDGSAGCTFGADCSVVYQTNTTFTADDVPPKAIVGTSTVTGATPGPNPLYIGAFDSAYENSTNPPTGNLYVCGNTGGPPTLYQIPIAAGNLPSTGIRITQFTTSAKTACSPVTDVFNANATGGATEWLFVSVEDNGRNPACAAIGCLFNFEDTVWQPTGTYAVGQEVLALSPTDNLLFINVVIAAGTSGATTPIWTDAAGSMTTDGTVQWINQGALTAAAQAVWSAGHLYAVPNRILDGNGNIEVATIAGTTGGTVPTWSTTPGGTTLDGTVTWTNAGALGSFVLPATGGTSGIIVDNTVGLGTLPGASQVYFSTLSDQACGTSGTGGCAVQASQSALQ
jgi:hypothetical protein